MSEAAERKNGKGKGGGNVLHIAADIILPFLIYYVVHDLAAVLLAFLTGLSLGCFGEGYRKFMEIHAASADGVRNGLALCIGALVVWPMTKRELQRAGNGKRRVELQPAGNRKRRAELQPAGNGKRRAESQPAGNGKRRVELQPAENEKRWVELQPARPQALEYVLLLVCAVSMALGINLLLTLAGLTGVSENYTEISARQYGVAFGLGLVLYGVVSPIAEETVFRGLIYNRMKGHMRAGAAIVLCGMLFGIYHGNLVQAIYGCVLGIGITLMYEWFGSIAAPILFHGAANVGVFAVSYGKEIFQGTASLVCCIGLLGISVACFILIGRKKFGVSRRDK